MIRLDFRAFDSAEWSQRLAAIPELSLLQTWAYGEAKARSGSWRTERAAIYDGERDIGSVQAFVRRIPVVGGGLVWINRGPLLREPARSDRRIWRETLEELRQSWVVERGMVLRIALPLRDRDGLDDVVPAEYRRSEAGEGFHSARLDLYQPLEILRRQLDQKWRNCLNKAERLDMRGESGVGEELFCAIIRDYSVMLGRKSFQTSVTPKLLMDLQAALPASEKLWSLVVRNGRDISGFVVIARYGDIAEYLAGSSSPEGRKSNVGHLLLWRAIAEMKAQGFRWFDVGGLDPMRTPDGIFHFKAGLHATAYRLADEIEASRNGIVPFAVRQLVRRARQSELRS